jgi:hypothetical protein
VERNSALLLLIAAGGKVAFAYIPDMSIVGTVFCHSISNALALAHFGCYALHGELAGPIHLEFHSKFLLHSSPPAACDSCR